jgi:hypothetical protein
MLNESLVRASVVRYLASREGDAAAAARVAEEHARWFLWIEELADLLKTYEESRETYRNLEAFVPRIAAYFETLSQRAVQLADQFERSRPYVVGMSPSNGSMDVDPATDEVSFRFSARMGKGVNINYGPGGSRPTHK